MARPLQVACRVYPKGASDLSAAYQQTEGTKLIVRVKLRDQLIRSPGATQRRNIWFVEAYRRYQRNDAR